MHASGNNQVAEVSHTLMQVFKNDKKKPPGKHKPDVQAVTHSEREKES